MTQKKQTQFEKLQRGALDPLTAVDTLGLIIDPSNRGLTDTVNKKRIRKTSYVWTINNPEPEDILDLKAMEIEDRMRYMCYQGETGEHGTKHLQGYTEFLKAVDFTWFKKKMKRAHIEFRKGTRDQARHYCMKPCEDEKCKSPHCISERKKGGIRWKPFFEIGTWKMDSGAGFWQGICKMIEEGSSDYDIFQMYPKAISQHRALMRYRETFLQDKLVNKNIKKPEWENREVKVIYLAGPTGVGKTWAVRAWAKNRLYVANEHDPHMWDLYAGQQIILMDEFSGKTPLPVMLQLLDKYPYQLRCRYYNRWLRAEYIFVVSNHSFRYLYDEASEKVKRAFERRFQGVLLMYDDRSVNDQRAKVKYDSLEAYMEKIEGGVKSSITFSPPPAVVANMSTEAKKVSE